ncbi:hypothetical protein RRG08_063331 [Elysia crispata]|uniref:Uncharacterized protein n=1 Tax=Elysia crispata TaxID=231223 RepID=A0AAE1DNA4_9GAST|nr:hypothetical protein RRG08_063331 [Elysia crispata]
MGILSELRARLSRKTLPRNTGSSLNRRRKPREEPRPESKLASRRSATGQLVPTACADPTSVSDSAAAEQAASSPNRAGLSVWSVKMSLECEMSLSTVLVLYITPQGGSLLHGLNTAVCGKAVPSFISYRAEY